MLSILVALACALSPAIRTHASALRDRGYTVLPADAIDSTLVASAAVACTTELEHHLSGVATLGIDPLEQAYSFSEICHRVRGRWDFRTSQQGVLAELFDAAEAVTAPVVRAVSRLPKHEDDAGLPLGGTILPAGRPRRRMSGAIVSCPGAIAQAFHVDASRAHLRGSALFRQHRLYNVFVPLVDIAADADGTQFWPGSHLQRTRERSLDEALARSGRLEDDVVAMAQMEAPACKAGGIIIFDYRCLHRGLANMQERTRPVAYCVLATGLARDRANFPETSWKAAAQTLPEEPELRRAVRQEIGSSMAASWDEVFADPNCRERLT